MKAFFEEHGGAIITVTVIIGLLAIMGILMATNGPIQDAIIGLINTLLTKAGAPNVSAAFMPGLF